jgi:hypothetical protein
MFRIATSGTGSARFVELSLEEGSPIEGLLDGDSMSLLEPRKRQEAKLFRQISQSRRLVWPAAAKAFRIGMRIARFD